MNIRFKYILIFIFLIAIEVCIAMFVHDRYIRPYGGDIIVVWVIYCFIQAILGGKNNHYIVALAVMCFAALVECLQFIHIVDLLGLGHIRFIKILIGNSFSWGDLLCYTIGTACTSLGIYFYKSKRQS